MKFGLKEETIEKINSVFEKYPEINEVIIYGSRAKGTNREGSDIDITLKGEGITEVMLSKILIEIDALNTPYLFDISLYHTLQSPELINHINRIGRVL